MLCLLLLWEDMVVEEAKPETVTELGFSLRISDLMMSLANLGIPLN